MAAKEYTRGKVGRRGEGEAEQRGSGEVSFLLLFGELVWFSLARTVRTWTPKSFVDDGAVTGPTQDIPDCFLRRSCKYNENRRYNIVECL